MSTSFCPYCHRPLQQAVICEGVVLPHLKALIFNVVRRAGQDGITSENINAIVFDGRSSTANIRNHILQINDAFAATDWVIRGDGAPRGYYRLLQHQQQNGPKGMRDGRRHCKSIAIARCRLSTTAADRQATGDGSMVEKDRRQSG
jgi:hypothetical protein